MKPERVWLRALTRSLLRVFPRDFRAQHGPDVLDFWEQQAREDRYDGVLGGVWLSMHLTWDAIARGVTLRMRPRRGTDDRRAVPDRGSWISGAGRQDLRYAVRSLQRSPLFTSVAVVTLALGIGATTALFSVVNGVLLRPLPFPEAERLVRVERVTPEGLADDVAWPDFQDWREQARGFVGMAAHAESRSSFGWDDVTESLSGALVTRDFFDVMRVPPTLGRTFTVEEDRLDGPDAVIISYALWQRRLGGSADVLSQTVVLDGAAVPIVGVMGQEFRAPYPDIEFWAPLQDDELLSRVGLPTGERSLSFLTAVGRLGDVSVSVVGAEFAALAQRIDTEVGRERAKGVRLTPLQETVVGDVQATLWMLMGAVLLVM
ncbi:MAG: hypothetical protein ACI9OJ_005917, partial [Myxococcota bacterium]